MSKACLLSSLATALLCSLPLALGSCAQAVQARSSADIVDKATALEVKNPSSPEPGLLCAGMLTEPQFDALVGDGFVTFINLRVPTEAGTGWEAARAEELHVTYINLPIEGAKGITEENARALDAQLDTIERPAVLYCGSSNRVGALYGLGAFYVDGVAPEVALEKAQSAGLTSLEPVVREKLGLPEPAPVK